MPARVATRSARGRAVGGWGFQAVLILVGALPAAVGVNLLLDPPTRAFSGTRAVGWYVLAFGLVPAILVGLELRRRVPDRSALGASAMATMAVLASAVGDGVLPQLAPFRFALLSLALYLAPTAALIAGLRLSRVRALVKAAAGALVVPVALAIPVAVMQRGVAAQQWIATGGAPDRLLAQVVALPDMNQEPYEWDRAGGRLIAFYDWPQGLISFGTIHLAAETVTPGNHPCAPVIVADGDSYHDVQPACTPLDDRMWRLTLNTDGAIGYAVTEGPVTVAVTAPAAMDRPVRAALRRAHPGDDTELWTRIPNRPTSLPDLLLL